MQETRQESREMVSIVKNGGKSSSGKCNQSSQTLRFNTFVLGEWCFLGCAIHGG